MEQEWSDMHDEEVGSKSKSERISVEVFVVAEGDHTIVGWLSEGLLHTIVKKTERHSDQPSKYECYRLIAMLNLMPNVDRVAYELRGVIKIWVHSHDIREGVMTNHMLVIPNIWGVEYKSDGHAPSVNLPVP